MLSHKIICDTVSKVAQLYPVKRVGYFGSYAKGTQTENSDLDVLVEFLSPSVSLLTLSDMRLCLEDNLQIPVDLIHAPIPQNALIDIGEVVPVYER